jgi:hypothetical protein
MIDKLGLLELFRDGSLQIGIAALFQGEVREEVVDEREKEGLVLVDQLGKVHVAEDSHHDGRLRVLGVRALRGAQCAQHGQNVAETKIVVNL